MQREADGSGAVVPGVLPRVVPAAVAVREVRDRVAGRDDRHDGRRGARGSDRETVGADRARPPGGAVAAWPVG